MRNRPDYSAYRGSGYESTVCHACLSLCEPGATLPPGYRMCHTGKADLPVPQDGCPHRTFLTEPVSFARPGSAAELFRNFEGSRLMMSADSTLTCRDCGRAFVFTAGEQDYYASRAFSEPGRCPDCRAARKSQRDGGSSYDSYGSPSRGSAGSRELFDVTCSSCGQPTQVPFQPSADRPVYCSSCFEKRRGGTDRSGGSRYGARSRY